MKAFGKLFWIALILYPHTHSFFAGLTLIGHLKIWNWSNCVTDHTNIEAMLHSVIKAKGLEYHFSKTLCGWSTWFHFVTNHRKQRKERAAAEDTSSCKHWKVNLWKYLMGFLTLFLTIWDNCTKTEAVSLSGGHERTDTDMANLVTPRLVTQRCAFN